MHSKFSRLLLKYKHVSENASTAPGEPVGPAVRPYGHHTDGQIIEMRFNLSFRA